MDALTPEVRAALVLAAALGESTRAVGVALREEGTAVKALQSLTRRADDERRRRIRQAGAGVPELLAKAAEVGARLVVWDGHDYPERLRELADPPPVLFVRGCLDPVPESGVAVVGTRAATPYGLRVAGWIAEELSDRGLAIHSGLAEGVDAAAHDGALRGRGGTVAVLGCGIDVAYPRRNQRLRRRIEAEGGWVLSEFLPGTPPLRHHFPRRNRIVAALGLATIVVEARSGSGSFITVDHALDLGRPVYGVPGPVDNPGSAGVHQMLREGASVFVGPDALIEDLAAPLSFLGRAKHSSERERAGRPVRASDPGEADSLWDALVDAADVEVLAARTGMSVSGVSRALTRLEIQGSVVRGPDGRYRRAVVR